MTNQEEAKTKMFSAVDTFLAKRSGVYLENPAFVVAKGVFNNAYDANILAGEKADTNNSGFSAEKLKAKKDAGWMAASLCGFAYVKFTAMGKLSLANKLLINESDYTKLADGRCSDALGEAQKILLDNINDLKPDYINNEQLGVLNATVENFDSTQGSSEEVHQTSPAYTAAYKKSFVPVMNSIKNLRLLGRFYAEIDTEFYEALLAVCTLPAISVRHTIISLHVVDAEKHEAIEGAECTETKTNKSSTTDFEGNATLKEVRSGDNVIIVKATGRKTATIHTSVKRGKNNAYEVILEKE